MKTKFLCTILLTFIGWNLYAQNNKCGTVNMTEKAKTNDPNYQARVDSLEKATQEWLKNNPNSKLKNADNHNNYYQSIPGFIKTGDAKIDAVNYAKAKEELKKNNPDEYKKLFANSEIDKITEEQKKKERAEKIEKEKNNH